MCTGKCSLTYLFNKVEASGVAWCFMAFSTFFWILFLFGTKGSTYAIELFPRARDGPTRRNVSRLYCQRAGFRPSPGALTKKPKTKKSPHT